MWFWFGSPTFLRLKFSGFELSSFSIVTARVDVILFRYVVGETVETGCRANTAREAAHLPRSRDIGYASFDFPGSFQNGGRQILHAHHGGIESAGRIDVAHQPFFARARDWLA